MTTFDNRTVTTEGRKLLVSVLVSGGAESIEFTALAIGDGALPDNPAGMTSLVHHVCDVAITQVESAQEGVATIRGAFTNSEERDAFYWREMGVYARIAGTDDTPILFAYANAGDTAELIGRVMEGSTTEHSIVLSLVVGDASVLTITDPLAAATLADIADTKKVLTAALSDHEKDTVKHITAGERTRWNDTPTKKELSDHATGVVHHITAAERTKWNTAANAAFITGMIIASGCTSMSGWLLCNGQAVSRTTYAKLYAAIGTKFGEGNGSTTFNVPDLRDKFPQGANGNLGAIIEAGLPPLKGKTGGHTRMNSKIADGVFADTTETSGWDGMSGKHSNNFATIDFNASNSNPIYGNSNTVQPPAVALNYFIKY